VTGFVVENYASNGTSALRGTISIPRGAVRGIGQIVASPEFNSLGRRNLFVDPNRALPRKTIDRLSAFERGVRKLIIVDARPSVDHGENSARIELPSMASAGAKLNTRNLGRQFGLTPRGTRDETPELTLVWMRSARVIAWG
jgi:hypothetical protein